MEAPIAPRKSRRALADVFFVCLGACGAALLWYLSPGLWQAPPAPELEPAFERREALRAAALAGTAAPAAPPPAVAPRGDCGFEPLIAPALASDGHARLEHPFPAGPRARAKVFLRTARAAAASGRKRDEERALIAACRHYAQASTAPTLALADVLATLGERYTVAAAVEPLFAERERLVARARHVLERSASTYESALGPNAARSREARQRVATLERDIALAGDAQAVQVRAPVAVRASPTPATEAAGRRAARGGPAPLARTPGPRPSTQQPAARTAPVRVAIDVDPAMRQLASDLERLRAQAAAVTADPAGLVRRSEVARVRREQCRDAACLRAWYERRRKELLAEF